LRQSPPGRAATSRKARSTLDPDVVGEGLDTLSKTSREIGFACAVSERVAYVHECGVGETGPPGQAVLKPEGERTCEVPSAVG